MISFLSSWAEQIVLAVIIATIIEMVLPENKNKKYIQMVIGIYVLFNVISPVIKNKEEFSIEKFDIEKYTSKQTQESVIDQTSMDKRLEKIYLDELEDKVKSKFENEEIDVIKCKIDAELDTTKKNAGIHLITLKLEGSKEEKKVENIKKELATEFEISEDKIQIQYTKK